MRMPLFYFNLDGGYERVADPDGTELADECAARAHAAEVAQEIMAHTEAKTRSWLLEVCDRDGLPLFELPFEKVDPTIRDFDPRLRRLIEDAAMTCRTSGRAIRDARATVRRARAAVARSNRAPWPVIEGGRRR
jgi:hypothetical protein